MKTTKEKLKKIIYKYFHSPLVTTNKGYSDEKFKEIFNISKLKNGCPLCGLSLDDDIWEEQRELLVEEILKEVAQE